MATGRDWNVNANVEPQNLPRSRKNCFKRCWSWIKTKVDSIWFQDLTEWFLVYCFEDSLQEPQVKIPRPYKFVQMLGSGTYGFTIQCKKPHSKDVVLKMAKDGLLYVLKREAEICQFLMEHKLDEANIVKYYGEIHNTRGVFVLEFELLHMTLGRCVNRWGQPRLADIRVVITDLAVALVALKRIGVIHADLKPDNIMLVDHIRQPYRVKVIDFGLAMYSKSAKPGKICQALSHRAPEVLLRLPFTEAIDIWSLGCIMAKLLWRVLLFPAYNELQMLQFIYELLGPPPERLVKASRILRNTFDENTDRQLPKETLRPSFFADKRSCHFRNLDEGKNVVQEKNNPMEAVERSEAIELLKAMLTWDAEDRIPPEGILNHPFITGSYEQQCAVVSQQAAAELSDPVKEPDDAELPSGVILVKPATPEHRYPMSEAADEPTGESADAPVRDSSDDHELPSGVTLVKPATPEKRCPEGNLTEEPVEHPEDSLVEDLHTGFTCSEDSSTLDTSGDVVNSSEPARDQMQPKIQAREIKKGLKEGFFSRCWSRIKKWACSIWF